MKKVHKQTNRKTPRKSGLTFGQVATGMSILRCIFGYKKTGCSKKVRWPVLVLCASMIMLPAQPARAIFGIGDIVFDPSVFMQTILGYVEQVTAAVNSATQIENQMKSLANEAQNLAYMDQGAAAQTISGIRQNLTQMFQMQARIRGMTMEYQSVESAWDQLYKDFGTFNGMSGKDYANQSQRVLDQTNKATYDAMRAQGLVAQIGNDEVNLTSLLTASNSASGAVAAAQAGNQIAALNTQQLMRLQQIAASSYRAESSYYAQQAQREAMANANMKRAFDMDPPKTKPLDGSGKGQGFKKF